jgi:ATP-dependent Clp protease ATP-binding subunit ClpA/ATP-dependent Clp protease ATP-binding subunit ClpC
VNFTLPVYQAKKRANFLKLTTVGLGPHTVLRAGAHVGKVEQLLIGALRDSLKTVRPAELEWFDLKIGTQLVRERFEFALRRQGGRKKLSGTYPLILEPRQAGADRALTIAYHPWRQTEWFPVVDDEPLGEQAAAFFAKAWAELDDDTLADLATDGKDSLRALAFDADPKSLLDELPRGKRSLWADLEAKPQKDDDKGSNEPRRPVLPAVGVNATRALLDGGLSLGLPRSPLREQLQLLVTGGAGQRPASVAVVGAPGCGKTVLIHRLIADLVETDGYNTHRNLDRVRQVWRVSGKRIIAGMQYLGDWEQRCVDLLRELRGTHTRALLWVEDLALWGKLGTHRDSDRSFASFFRGPIERGEVVMLAEMTEAQLARLEEDAPQFAALFTRLAVPAATRSDTLQMMIHRAREIEARRPVYYDAYSYAAALELGAALYPGTALPGQALDLLAAAADTVDPDDPDDDNSVSRWNLVAIASRRTGLPTTLLSSSHVLDTKLLRAQLSSAVVEQPAATEAGVDLVARIKTGLVDSRRPFGVYLFTGPTGTGKTEMAKVLARTLYGDERRMRRFDMGELSGPDAPARLIGDRAQPEGLLTTALIEQPFSLVLLDEIEKAHPSVLNLLLQVFEDGRLTDANGNVARFTQSVIVMTSNLGQKTRPAAGFGEESPEALLADVSRAVREFFPPELFNRIDRVVPFRPLSATAAARIVETALKRLLSRRGLVDRSVVVRVGPGVVDALVADAFDPRDGARSVKRRLEDGIGGEMAEVLATARRAPLTFATIEKAPERGYRFELTPLVEASVLPGRVLLEPLLGLSARELRQHLPEARAQVAQLIDSLGTIADLGMREELRSEAQESAEQLRAIAELPLDATEELEIARFGYDETVNRSRVRVLDRAAFTPSPPRIDRDAILDAIARVGLLSRLVARQAPIQSSVTLLVELVGDGTSRSLLLDWLRDAYVWGLATNCHTLRESGMRVRGWETTGRIRAIGLALFGVGVAETFAAEEGVHVWQSLQSPAEIVRVRIVEGTSEAALDKITSSPTASPRDLPPVVRRIRWELPPMTGGMRSTPCDLEDYRLGWTSTDRVRRPDEAIRRALRLHRSRAEDSRPSPSPDGARKAES